MSDESPKIYVISDSGHDLSPAIKYGELVIMSKGYVDKYNTSQMVRTFAPYMVESKPNDFILISGPTVMSSIACSMFSAKHGKLNLLLWRAEQDGNDRYLHRRLVYA